MRVRVIFFLKNRGAYIPFHHQFLLAQVLKAILIKGGNQKYASSKNFNFSGLKGQTKPSRKGLHFYSSRVTLVISSQDKGFMDYLLYNLMSMPRLEIGSMLLVPEKVEVESIAGVRDLDKFICLSPLVLLEPQIMNDEAKAFVGPETDEFSDLVYDSTMQRLEDSGLFSPEKMEEFKNFQIVPDQAYLDKVVQEHKKFSRVYPVYDQDVKFEIRGYTFPFNLYAEQEVKEFVFMNGLGAMTHKGFGMIDMAYHDPNERVQEYDVPDITAADYDPDSDSQ